MSLSECSHGNDGGLGSAPITSLGTWSQVREVLQLLPVLPPPLIPEEAQGMGNFWYTLLPAESHAEVAGCQHETRALGTHSDPSAAQAGFERAFQERVAVRVWVSPSGLLSWWLCAMLLTWNIPLSTIPILHLIVSSSFPLPRAMLQQCNRTVFAFCWMRNSWRQMIVWVTWLLPGHFVSLFGPWKNRLPVPLEAGLC